MNKYYFVNIGAEVIWHPVNSDEKKVMQVCTSAPHPVENDTLVSLIFSDKKGNVKVKAVELTPKLTDFNQGYWCALQDAVSNGASDTVIQEMLRSAGHVTTRQAPFHDLRGIWHHCCVLPAMIHR